MAQSKVETRTKGKAKAKLEPKAQAAAEAKAPPEQLTFEAEAPVADAGPRAPAAAAMAANDAVIELLRNRKGYWKRLANGEGIAISEKEWQQELSRLLSRRATPASDPGERPNS